MRAQEFIIEKKQQKTKPVQPNPVAKNAMASVGGGGFGAHKDKKAAMKRGDEKHKKNYAMTAEASKPRNPTRDHLRRYPVPADQMARPVKKKDEKKSVAEGSEKNVVKSVKVGNFRHDLVDTEMGWQVRIYNGDELYDTGLSKNSEQKGLAALEDAVAYTEKLTRTKRQGVAEADKLQGTPVVSLKDFGDKDNTKNKYGQTVPKKLKKDDPRVKFHKDQKQGVAEGEDDWGSMNKRDFKRKEMEYELRNEPPNNIQVVINGKPWKVFAGRGRPDSAEEFNHLRKMQAWAANKSSATGKKWSVHLTGAPASK